MRLQLLRHWSLYEALYHSSFVASRLLLWKAEGKAELDTFLARMGIPLKQCKQRYTFMTVKTQRSLVDKIRNQLASDGAAVEQGSEDVSDGMGSHYGKALQGLFYGSFEQYQGFSTAVSAADVVYAVTALLETQPSTTFGVSLDHDVSNRAASGEQADSALALAAAAADATSATAADGSAVADAASAAAERARALAEESAWEHCFNAAYDALGSSPRALQLQRKGIELSMTQARAVVRVGVSLLENRRVSNLGPFRYCVLSTLADADAAMFSQPLALAKLGRFLVDAYKAMRRRSSTLPLVLCVLKERAGVYLVAAVTAPPQLGEVLRNNFGAAFRIAAENIDATVQHDHFESSIMQIRREDLGRFTDALVYTLSTSKGSSGGGSGERRKKRSKPSGGGGGGGGGNDQDDNDAASGDDAAENGESGGVSNSAVPGAEDAAAATDAGLEEAIDRHGGDNLTAPIIASTPPLLSEDEDATINDEHQGDDSAEL